MHPATVKVVNQCGKAINQTRRFRRRSFLLFVVNLELLVLNGLNSLYQPFGTYRLLCYGATIATGLAIYFHFRLFKLATFWIWEYSEIRRLFMMADSAKKTSQLECYLDQLHAVHKTSLRRLLKQKP